MVSGFLMIGSFFVWGYSVYLLFRKRWKRAFQIFGVATGILILSLATQPKALVTNVSSGTNEAASVLPSKEAGISKAEFDKRTKEIQSGLNHIATSRGARNIYKAAQFYVDYGRDCRLDACRAFRYFAKEASNATEDGFLTPKEEGEMLQLIQHIKDCLAKDRLAVVDDKVDAKTRKPTSGN